MEIQKDITTPSLRKRTAAAIKAIYPYFSLSSDEINAVERFSIKRTLKHFPKSCQTHNEKVPGYDIIRGFFYFPPFDEVHWADDEDTIYHESGHHLHFIANPKFGDERRLFLKNKQKSSENMHFKVHIDLSELVAEYPCMILGLRDYTKGAAAFFHENLKRVYAQYGASFLPVVARMSTEEAIRSKIILINRKP